MKETLPPIPVKKALLKLGKDLQDARKRRRISVEMMSKRASISRMTLYKIEKGDSGVSVRSYAKVIFSLGLLDNLSQLADIKNDSLGLELEKLPQRIRYSKKKK